MHPSFRAIALGVASVAVLVCAGCSKDSPTETPDPWTSAPVHGFWPMTVGNVWTFTYSYVWFDLKVFSVGVASEKHYSGTLEWQVAATRTTASGFVATIRQRFIGGATEKRLKSAEPVVWDTVTFAIADTARSFDIVVHADGTLSVDNAPPTIWDEGYLYTMVLPLARVPPATDDSRTLTFSAFARWIDLKRLVGPVFLAYYNDQAESKVALNGVIKSYTIIGP